MCLSTVMLFHRIVLYSGQDTDGNMLPTPPPPPPPPFRGTTSLFQGQDAVYQTGSISPVNTDTHVE